jgi:hypothetical protein
MGNSPPYPTCKVNGKYVTHGNEEKKEKKRERKSYVCEIV